VQVDVSMSPEYAAASHIARRLRIRVGRIECAMLALLLSGAALITLGAYEAGYLQSALLEVGAALFLAVPLVFLERLVEHRINAFERAAERSLGDVKTQVESVRQEVQEARMKIDELGRETGGLIADARAADAAAVEALRNDVSEPNVCRVLRRAQNIGALGANGIRVGLRGGDVWVRFTPASEHGENGDPEAVYLVVEDRAGDPIARGEVWSPGEPAAQALARLATELQRVDRYPGDPSYDAGWIFNRLAETLDAVLSLRTGRRQGAHLGPLIELVGEWAITAIGLQHIENEEWRVELVPLKQNGESVRAGALAEDADDGSREQFYEALRTARAYHKGEDQRKAERLVRRRAGVAGRGD
jgi:hypothetical protein